LFEVSKSIIGSSALSSAADLTAAGVEDTTEVDMPEADGETTALPLDKTQRIRKARRTSEMWAANMLAEDDTFRQPCMMPTLDTVPFKLREKVIKLYVRCVGDLQAATAEHQRLAAKDDEVATKLAEQRKIGAWVIVMRIFPAAILRDAGGGD
jgi:hypothetical protein